MITGMLHVGISVRDIERSIAFYRDVLGMELLGGSPFGGPQFENVMELKGAEGRLCLMKLGSLEIELFQFDHPQPKEQDLAYPVADHGITHFAVSVDDIDATYERLRAAGVRFHYPPQTYFGRTRAAYARDPDGNVFELIQELAP